MPEKNRPKGSRRIEKRKNPGSHSGYKESGEEMRDRYQAYYGEQTLYSGYDERTSIVVER